jgi:hypothetical protein
VAESCVQDARRLLPRQIECDDPALRGDKAAKAVSGRCRLVPVEGQFVTSDSPIVVLDIPYGRQMSGLA